MPSARNGLLVRGARRAALWMVAAGACAGIGEVASAQVTLSAGGGVGIDTRQPGLALRIVVQTDAQLGSGVPLRMFAFSPGFMSEWPSADGRLLSRAANPDLFSMLGTTYGSTNASNFALPDLRNAAMIGTGSTPVTGELSVSPGQIVGANTVSLVAANLPAHSHSVPGTAYLSPTGVTGTAGPGGAGAAFSNVQRSVGVYASIIANGIFPSQGQFFYAPGDPPISSVLFHAGPRTNAGALPMAGQLLQRSSNNALFVLLGTTYGGAATTFGIPDLRGRLAMGTGAGSGTVNAVLGVPLGSNTTTLGAGQIPGHSHGLPGGMFTGVFGGADVVISNEQRSFPLRFFVLREGMYPTGDAPLEEEGYVGEIFAFAGTQPAQDMILCDGRLLPISQNVELFQVMGITYGGDGVTNFRVPDLRGRVVIGAGPGTPEGTVLGATNRTIGASNLPAHTHTLTARSCATSDLANTDGVPPPDGVVDNGDFTAFFNAFFLDASDPARLVADIADTDGRAARDGGGPDGAVDNGDFTAFFGSFFNGCVD